jgi:beta-phosphoglucomutase
MTYGIIWDVDGTLVDTAELHFRAWTALATALGKPFTREDFAGTFGWRNAEILPKLFGNAYSPAEMVELADRKEALYRTEARNGIDLLPGVRKLLEELHGTGFRQAIGSSAPRANVELILEMTGIEPLLEASVVSEDTTHGKPHPEVFLIAARRLGVEPRQCLVFEDAPVGIEAARAGGRRAVGVTFVGHHPADKLQRAGADRVVTSLEEVDVDMVRTLLSQARG